MAIFARLDPATWGKAPAMKEFVQMATLLVLEGETRPTLAHVKQCLLDEQYRATLLPHCTNVDVQTFWTVTFPTQGEQQRSSLHALLRRFSQLLTTETTRYMISQPASRLNLLDAIERQLAHGEQNGVRAAYNYAEHLPLRRQMMQAWADWIDGLPKPVTNSPAKTFTQSD